MGTHHATAAGLVIAIVLASCGGDEGKEPMSPSNSKPIVPKQRTLSAAEYPAVREWIIGSGSSSAELRPICESRCPGDYQCAARILAGSFRSQSVNVKRVFITYYADIADVVQKGPCLNVLAPPDALKKFESSMRRFDDAVAELAHGNRAAYDRLDSTEADLDDPTPCRPS